MSEVLFDGNRVSPRRSGSDHSPLLQSIREEGSKPHPVRTMVKRDSITGTSPTRIRGRIHDDSTSADDLAQEIGSGYFGNDGPSVPLGVVRIEMSRTSHEATIVIDPAAQSSVSGETRCQLDSSTALKASPQQGIPLFDETKAMQKITVKCDTDDAPAQQTAAVLAPNDHNTFLHVLWRMVIITWLGGFISKLTGAQHSS